jgi:hypothetical protein
MKPAYAQARFSGSAEAGGIGRRRRAVKGLEQFRTQNRYTLLLELL